jgi:hypothetical protein
MSFRPTLTLSEAEGERERRNLQLFFSALCRMPLESPLNPFQETPQLRPSGCIHHLHKRHAPRKVCSEVSVILTILRRRPMTYAVRQDRLQPVVVRSRNIQPLVRHNPRQILPHPLPHDPRLAMMNSKSLLQQNRRSPDSESFNPALERRVSRESKIVGVACIDRAAGLSKPSESAINPVAADIRQRRRRWRSLRQMRPCVKTSCLGHAQQIKSNPLLLPKCARNSVGAETAQQVRNRLGISGRAKHRLYARRRNCGKKIPQIHPQNNPLSDVRRCKRPDRTPAAKPMHRRMHRNLPQNLSEYLLLKPLQSFLRRFNQPDCPALLRQNPIVIVAERACIIRRPETSHIPT